MLSLINITLRCPRPLLPGRWSHPGPRAAGQAGLGAVTDACPTDSKWQTWGNFQQLSTEIPYPGNLQGAAGGMGGRRGSWAASCPLVASLATPVIQGLPGFHLLRPTTRILIACPVLGPSTLLVCPWSWVYPRAVPAAKGSPHPGNQRPQTCQHLLNQTNYVSHPRAVRA